ncbi:1076_t:CDS:2 [Diversispora eburnea]|uniref:1076_t:CDS:1 n=1 Tax=Diversispora eburnea TaxID=1213867 RepID=A0A9N9F624_9GLOM|nr:1076_t:CDS:2 [Diversispora eburnea]
MVLKSKKRASPNKYSPIYKCTIKELPTEILLMTFSYLDISTLLCLSNVCKRFQIIGETCLAVKFKEPNVSLNLLFEQEHKWNYPVDFYFDHLNLNNGRFIFKPKAIEKIKFIHSSMVKKPTLYKVQIQRNKIIEPLMENFLQKSYALSTKEINTTIEKVASVYRIGHGSNHLKIPFKFTYSVTDIPPPTESINRGGERWITPKEFECFPRKNAIRNSLEIELDIDGQEIIHIRRRNSINSITHLSLLEEVQDQHENTLMIRKIMDPIKSSSKWLLGPRR